MKRLVLLAALLLVACRAVIDLAPETDAGVDGGVFPDAVPDDATFAPDANFPDAQL